MVSDDKAKTDLLRELESLRAQLTDPAADDISEERIPLLLDRVEQAVGDAGGNDESVDDAEATLRAAYDSQTQDLQSSETELVEQAIARLKEDRQLIDDVLAEVPSGSADTGGSSPGIFEYHEDQEPLIDHPRGELPSSRTTHSRPVARGENPFLPKHIRDRLQERRQKLADDIAQAASFFPKETDGRRASHPRQDHPAIAHQQLIDDLVASYLPRIERDLRARLTRKLQQGELDLDPPTDAD